MIEKRWIILWNNHIMIWIVESTQDECDIRIKKDNEIKSNSVL